MQNRDLIHPTRFSIVAELALLFAGFFALYTFTISGNLAASHDSITYINAIDAGKDLFHPHHLLYQGLAAIWVGLWRILGIASDSVVLVSALNAIFGALTVCVFYKLLRQRLQWKSPWALVGTMLPAFSFGFWFYSVCVEVYIIPLFFLMLSFYLLTSDQADKTNFVLVGFTHGTAILFHQVHVLFTPVVFAAVLLNRRRTRTLAARRALAQYALILALTVAIPYLLVIMIVLRLDTLEKAWYWLTLYAHDPAYWNPLALSTLFKAGVGFGRSIVGSHFVFAIPAISAFVERVFQGKWLIDEAYLVRNLDKKVALVLLGLDGVLWATILATVLARFRSWRILWNHQRRVTLLALVWFAIYAAFFFFWDSSNVEFWIPQSVCWWLIFLMLCSPSLSSAQHCDSNLVVLFVAALIFTTNLSSIVFLRDRNNDYYYAKIDPLSRLAQRGDLIVIGRSWIWEGYVRRYTAANVFSLTTAYADARDAEAFKQRAQDAIRRTLERRNTVLISGEAVEVEQETLLTSGIRAEVIADLWNQYRERWQRLNLPISTVYVLDAK